MRKALIIAFVLALLPTIALAQAPAPAKQAQTQPAPTKQTPTKQTPAAAPARRKVPKSELTLPGKDTILDYYKGQLEWEFFGLKTAKKFFLYGKQVVDKKNKRIIMIVTLRDFEDPTTVFTVRNRFVEDKPGQWKGEFWNQKGVRFEFDAKVELVNQMPKTISWNYTTKDVIDDFNRSKGERTERRVSKWVWEGNTFTNTGATTLATGEKIESGTQTMTKIAQAEYDKGIEALAAKAKIKKGLPMPNEGLDVDKLK